MSWFINLLLKMNYVRIYHQFFLTGGQGLLYCDKLPSDTKPKAGFLPWGKRQVVVVFYFYSQHKWCNIRHSADSYRSLWSFWSLYILKPLSLLYVFTSFYLFQSPKVPDGFCTKDNECVEGQTVIAGHGKHKHLLHCCYIVIYNPLVCFLFPEP